MDQTTHALPAQRRADVRELLNARLADRMDLMRHVKQMHGHGKGSRATRRCGVPPQPPRASSASSCSPPPAVPKRWAERAYHTLIYYHRVDTGGHFAAWEEPQLFAEEIRAAFRSLCSSWPAALMRDGV